MKKSLVIIVIVIALIVLGFIFFYNSNTNNNTNENTNTVSGEKLSSNLNEEQSENRIANILQNQNEIIQKANNETEISSYSTTIKDKAAGRLTNISITCSTLNDTIVKAGETFSFNETIGKPTAERGYQEASIIIDHKTEKGIGRWKLPSK